ncbi:MAG: hypothetical protein PVI11_09185, partial [Candidatus Aminicenantes bacterium]
MFGKLKRRKNSLFFLSGIFSVGFIFSLASCQEGKFSHVKIDLLAEFAFAEKIQETQFVDLTKPSARPFLLDGWSVVEKGGTWAASLETKLKFYTLYPSRDKKMVCSCYPFSFPGAPNQSLKVYLNDQFVGQKKMTKGT